MSNELNEEQINQLRAELQSENEELRSQISDLRQELRENNDSSDNFEGDNMDSLINQDINKSNERPQTTPAGLSTNNKHFGDLSNHELHQIKKIHEEDHKRKPKTILDESLGDIMDKLVNFLTYSFEGYSKAVYEAEVMEDVYDDDKSMYQSIKVHLIAIILFMRDDQNILYIGILLIFISMIMYLMNITTS